MNLNLIPLGDRVLIKPHERPAQTESGILLSEHRKPDTAGTVVAVGRKEHPRKADAERLAELFASRPGGIGDWSYEDMSALLRELVWREPQVKFGDYVLFSWQSGQEFIMDHERFLIMHEDDILAVVEEGEVTVG